MEIICNMPDASTITSGLFEFGIADKELLKRCQHSGRDIGHLLRIS